MTNFNSIFGKTLKGYNKSMATVINSLSSFTRVAVLMAVITIASATPAAAQFTFGIKGGVTTTEMKDKNSLLDSRHHTDYNAGLILDMNIPKVNLGLEVSAQYRFVQNNQKGVEFYKRHYIDIPVYVRYRLAIPGVDRVVAPVVFTGPNVSLLVKDGKDLDGEDRARLSWDVGAGVDLFKHLRVTASYGIGMKKAMEYIGKEYNGEPVEGKDHCWTVSAAYMF